MRNTRDSSNTAPMAALPLVRLVAAAAYRAGAGVVTVGLLAYKSTLHGFLSRITSQELRSALLLAAMTFIALPLLPDRTIDPWGAILAELDGETPGVAVADIDLAAVGAARGRVPAPRSCSATSWSCSCCSPRRSGSPRVGSGRRSGRL